jgi:hypothetical protein
VTAKVCPPPIHGLATVARFSFRQAASAGIVLEAIRAENVTVVSFHAKIINMTIIVRFCEM